MEWTALCEHLQAMENYERDLSSGSTLHSHTPVNWTLEPICATSHVKFKHSTYYLLESSFSVLWMLQADNGQSPLYTHNWLELLTGEPSTTKPSPALTAGDPVIKSLHLVKLMLWKHVHNGKVGAFCFANALWSIRMVALQCGENVDQTNPLIGSVNAPKSQHTSASQKSSSSASYLKIKEHQPSLSRSSAACE